jgi:PBP1b-binding outer membrane lipoprotein LpoB
MKKISMITFIVAFAFACNAQVNKTPPYQKADTATVDPARLDKINEMPMDTLNNKLSPSPPDSTKPKRTGDDEDPNRVDPKKRKD